MGQRLVLLICLYCALTNRCLFLHINNSRISWQSYTHKNIYKYTCIKVKKQRKKRQKVWPISWTIQIKFQALLPPHSLVVPGGCSILPFFAPQFLHNSTRHLWWDMYLKGLEFGNRFKLLRLCWSVKLVKNLMWEHFSHEISGIVYCESDHRYCKNFFCFRCISADLFSEDN